MPSKRKLRTVGSEDKDLRARLEKAEASLREILSGEADALFVSGEGGAQIYALKGADQSYRTLIENMSEGALTLTTEGLILYANRRFAEMLGAPLEKVIGSDIQAWLAPESRVDFQTLLKKNALNNRREELTLAAADGTRVPVNLSVSNQVSGELPGSVCMVATDLTQQKRDEAVLAADKLARAILEQAADVIVICDADGRIIRASKQAQTRYGDNPLGQHFEHAFPLRQLDGTAFSPIGAIDTNRHRSVEATLERNGHTFDLLVSVGHLNGAQNELLGSVITLTDITERKTHELALQKSERQLSEALMIAKMGYWVYEAATDEFIFNDQYYALHNITAEEAGGYRMSRADFVRRYISPDTASVMAKDMQLALTSQDPDFSNETEARILSGNGEILWVDVRYRIQKDLQGNTTHLLGIVQDINDRKLAENELRESENEFHTLAEAMPQIVWITRADGWNIYFNQHWMDYTGLTLEESLGHGWLKPFHPDDQQQAWDAWNKATMTAGIYSIESRLCRADGVYRWWLVRGVPLLDADGNILKWFGTCTDIHDLKMAELEIVHANGELRESERRFSDLLGNVELVSMMLDREARITYCNDYLLRLTGWTREEIIGKNWWDIFLPPEILDLRDDFFAALLANRPEARHNENNILTRSGARRRIRWNNSVLRSGAGEVIGTASIGEDITERKNAEGNLAANEALLKEFIRHTPAAIAMLDRQLRYIQTSERWVQDYNLVGQDIIGKSHYTIFPEISQRWKDIHQRVLAGAIEHCDEDPFPRADGSTDWLQWQARPWYQSKDKIGGIIFFTQVITERKQAEARIAHLNRVLLVLSSINALIVRANDHQELFRGACNIAVDAGGFRMAMLVIMDPVTMLPVSITSAGKNEALLAEIKSVLSSSEGMRTTLIGKVLRESKVVISHDTQKDPGLVFGKQYAEAGVKSMMVFPLIISGSTLGVLALYASETNFFQNEEMKLLAQLAGDIAFAIDHIDKQERLNYLAYHDVLTGLANRTLFHERLAQSVANANEQGRIVAVVLLDIERFKIINDTLGRDAGDALLRNVAERMLTSSADASRLARFDADHFAVLVQNSGTRDDVALLIEKRIGEIFKPAFRIGESELRITAKFGISMFPDDGIDADTLLKNAEVALKRGKATGESYLFYTQQMTQALAGRMVLENQLRQAVDNEEFVLYYQPKVNLVSGKVTSAEALIRWNDPRTGLVPPGRFIHVLEETGLIYDVGRWALRQAISDYLRWRQAGLPAVRIAVNVSALQLRNGRFIDEVRQAIAVDAQAAVGLELEITESLIMEDVKGTIASLQAIRSLGVTIAIDDFGTGFSSLAYLARLPVDTLKIDRSFVIDMTAGPQGLSLVSTIINLAHALELKVVAEGVETEEQSRLLRLLNCDEIQGYLFSPALPVETFEKKYLGAVVPVEA
jgi:diguanylate cyclase (GGDEF)-like protein/PAS domain S-box-containing protein